MQVSTSAGISKVSLKEIQSQLARSPSLPSLGSINKALQDLLLMESRFTAQIAEIIRRDPSLTARLLRLVNSVYYGLTTPVSSIEEAVFYLGVREIRQLVVVTPLIEDFQRLSKQCDFPWREFWQHCIGTALLTREIVSAVQMPGEESEYVAGLVHDIGKLVMAWAFPDHLAEIHRQAVETKRDLIEIESEILGMDHAELGALYLERHRLPEMMVKTARFHHQPEKADAHQRVVASAQIADMLLRSEKIGISGNYAEITREQCMQASGWKILLNDTQEMERTIIQASLSNKLETIPRMLEGLV
ncbi:MAG TPA: HDOD domain-containing protein [Candidatus Acidoferrales bacterium]|nr:HDOD domain-containing protein [Candidatus Acidoferrales bacterium]